MSRHDANSLAVLVCDLTEANAVHVAMQDNHQVPMLAGGRHSHGVELASRTQVHVEEIGFAVQSEQHLFSIRKEQC